MIISKAYISPVADELIRTSPLARQAYQEIERSIKTNHSDGKKIFVINSLNKNGNGVVPIKEKIYEKLENNYEWYREKPLSYLKNEARKGGPIDVYKEFHSRDTIFCAGLEFETGNISSAHRSMNKLCLGILKGELDMAFLILPVTKLSYYLTDRVSNYEELAPYFVLLNSYPFVVLGFDAEEYSTDAPVLSKGSDGMSTRSIRRWRK